MSPERWQRINQLFHGARELAAEEQAAFLDSTCADDKALCRELLAMLAVALKDDHQRTGANFFAGTPIPLFDVGSLGRRLSRYVYDVSADGQRFLLIRQLDDASLRPLTVVQNWTEPLKK